LKEFVQNQNLTFDIDDLEVNKNLNEEVNINIAISIVIICIVNGCSHGVPNDYSVTVYIKAKEKGKKEKKQAMSSILIHFQYCASSKGYSGISIMWL
jgi:hypothetical protein